MLAVRWWRGVRREQRGVHARTASENLLRHSLGRRSEPPYTINSNVGLPPHAARGRLSNLAFRKARL